jgi:hypothetical protein
MPLAELVPVVLDIYSSVFSVSVRPKLMTAKQLKAQLGKRTKGARIGRCTSGFLGLSRKYLCMEHVALDAEVRYTAKARAFVPGLMEEIEIEYVVKPKLLQPNGSGRSTHGGRAKASSPQASLYVLLPDGGSMDFADYLRETVRQHKEYWGKALLVHQMLKGLEDELLAAICGPDLLDVVPAAVRKGDLRNPYSQICLMLTHLFNVSARKTHGWLRKKWRLAVKGENPGVRLARITYHYDRKGDELTTPDVALDTQLLLKF